MPSGDFMNFKNVVNNIKYEFFQVKSAKLTWIINFVVPLVWLIPFLVICEWFGKKESLHMDGLGLNSISYIE
jgi:hypothetical protein